MHVRTLASPILNVPAFNVSQIEALIIGILKLVSDVKSNKKWRSYDLSKAEGANSAIEREREREGHQVRPLYQEGGGDDQPVGQLQGPEKSSRNHEWLEQLISIMIWLTGAIN